MTKYIDLKEFVDFGFLQEVNRQFLHRLGLALEVERDASGAYRLSGVQDWRGDQAGIIFDGIDPLKEKRVRDYFQRRAIVRQAALGYVVQPVPAVPEVELCS